jgi:hypothetical protein
MLHVLVTRGVPLALLLFAGLALASPINEFSVAAGVDSAYDSNVYNGRGPDYVNRISPRAGYRLLDPRVKLETGYELGYWTYAFGKAENSLNHRGLVSLEAHPVRRFAIQIADELDRAEDPGFLLRFGVVAPQIGITDNVGDLLMDYAFTRRLHGAIGYTNHLARFDAYTPAQAATNPPALFDGMQQDAQVHFSYLVLRTDELRMTGRFQNFSAGPQAISVAQWQLANTYTPELGWRHHFTPDLQWTIDGGPLFFQALSAASNIPGATQSSGVTGRGATSLRWATPSWRASVSYTHDLIGATGAGSALWADAVYAQAGYHWLDRLDAHAGGGYFRNGRAVNQEVAYDGFTADAIVDYRVLNYFRIGGYYTLRWQRTGPGSVVPGTPVAQFPTVTRNVVGIRLLAVYGADARPPKREVKE